ncbi:MAG: hypothetical protein QOE06_3570 [Thermoleophilaceae bacterium]|jgi:hypothetical protein|nr:hypothetical protein [Thermoleophilaceae bacterium]
MNTKLLTALALTLALPAAAVADGLPSGVNADSGGITTPSSHANYTVVAAGRGTTVERVDRRSGRLLASAYLGSKFALPAVAQDGTPSGLSAGGGTLVLIRPRVSFPQHTTTLALIDGQRLRIRRTLRLHGDFSFDGISPDGATLYLIEYQSPVDFLRYAVRAYDVRGGRLLPGQIVDPRQPNEKMSGYPITRATSAHGRWAYTLYDGAEHPFVHALDTVRRRAFCIDLNAVSKDALVNVSLALGDGGRTLALRRHGRTLAFIDTRTFAVTGTGARRGRTTGSGGSSWPLLGIGGSALLAVGGAAAIGARRRRRVLARGARA